VSAVAAPRRAHRRVRHVLLPEELIGPVQVNPRDRFLAERAAHLASRRCALSGCDGPLPCPDHGDVAEDRGQWLWPAL
jgi:hypothetical protein